MRCDEALNGLGDLFTEIVRAAHQRNASAVHYHFGSRDEILRSVQKKHRRLFISICAMIEQEIGPAVAKSRRRAIYERLAQLFGEL